LAAIAISRDQLAGATPLEQLIGAWLLDLCADALDDEWLAALPAPLLADVAVAVARADLPRLPLQMPVRWCTHLVAILASDRELEPHELGMPSSLLAWRHGFSVRSAGIARACALVAAVRAFVDATPGNEGWPARRRRLEVLVAEDVARGGPWVTPLLDDLAAREAAVRRAIAKLRLLRVAVAAAAGQEPPVLQDPLGDGPLRCEVATDGRWVRSGEAGGPARRCEVRGAGR
jgi:hypothetical protein